MTKPTKDLVLAGSEFILYAAPDGAVKVRVLFRDETPWLTQKALAELFGVKVPAINKHLKNIFESGELKEDSVVSILEITATDGKIYKTRFYNLNNKLHWAITGQTAAKLIYASADAIKLLSSEIRIKNIERFIKRVA